MSFPTISPKQSFPALESEILAYWKANDTFRKSVESRPADNPYRFYDGPPFITGMPHYGHLLGSTVKDAVGRYWTMRGRRVERTWGWDCHGLPIEERVQKKLGLKSNADIEAHGVKNFIDECYKYTGEVSSEWDWYINTIGRWVDMDNAYRTMDQDYMESVMWVFSQLWEKGLIYEGKRVSLYSWKLGTPISNFEVAMDDTYQTVDDPAITVKFELEPNDRFLAGTKVLAWTTTPWTIPANMALAVRNDIDYVLVSLPSLQRGMPEGQGDFAPETIEKNPQSLRDSSFTKELTEQFIVAKNRVEIVFKGKGEYTVIRELKGSELVGLGYIPPFPEYYYKKYGEKNHKIYHADFITDTDGTGIGHEAPEFGDVDFQLAKREGIFISEAMDEAGKYTSQIFDYEGTHYLDLENPEKGANKINIERMKANGTLFKLEGITHRVPFCPRSGTPLMQKAQASWFINIQREKDNLLAANEQINWFPEHLKHGRFGKGIESAPDWCISRTRYWGAPMPVWQNADASERVVVSSREEIYEMNKPYGQLEKREVEGKMKYYFKGGEFDGTEFNLHKPYIDSIFLAPKNTKKPKKVLGIHGWTSRGLKSGEDGFWSYSKEQFEQAGIEMDVPDFDKSEDTKYSLWRDQIDTLNIEQYDTVVAHSLGCAIAMQYIVEKKIKIDRLILVAPSGLVGNPFLEKLLPEMTVEKSELRKYVTEIIILHSKDDDADSAKYIYGKNLAEEISAELVTIDGFGHSMKGGGANIVHAIAFFGAPLIRISEVLDVWMDSGSMPYAQMHYPFENKGEMEASFPADFIAEYVGQVRAWFYVMHVLGVLLNPNKEPKPTPSFTNVITTGVINGNDGRKMSKSFGNYPDPRITIEKYGADPIRFYMLNSPLLSGGDMDFKEEQIIDTVKGVMLPLWNTYSFFTTYANIDNWKQDETEVWFSRHAESTANALNTMSDGTDDPKLTEKGREQAKDAGKILREQGQNFDIILHTSRIRTANTASIIAEEIRFTGEYIIDDRFTEQAAGEYAGKTLDEIAKMGGIVGSSLKNHPELRKLYKNNSIENIEQFEKRIIDAYKDIFEKNPGKKILIVAHAGTSRPILSHYFGLEKDKAHYDTRILNAEPFRLMTTPLVNDLDRWILSKLQVLMGQVHDAMEGYDISHACRAIVDYMDHMTNWYVRLSRRRFWESGMTPDKSSAYSTLHTVLVELSKLIAPFMPFLAESVYRGLTDNARHPELTKDPGIQEPGFFVPQNDGTDENSVHLQYVTFPNRHLIANDLNRDMEKCEQIVSLGLALRSQKNIRVRQPLQSVTITAELDEYYKSIIRDELNVKEIKLENPEKLAKKIAKPDAKKIGPKYGKDVQSIIVAAKNGEFVEMEDGRLSVGKVILEVGEYILEYLPLEGVGDVIGGYGMVVAMDTEITGDLRLEGYARDIVRMIQDMRKEADYHVADRISLSLGGEGSSDIVSKFGGMIASETLSTLVIDLPSPDIEKSEIIDEGVSVVISLKK